MLKTERIKLAVVLVVIAMVTVVCGISTGEQPTGEALTAAFKELSGDVSILKASEAEFKAAALNMMLEVNDQVLTGETGRARVDLSDGTIVRLSPLSSFTLLQMETTDQGTLTRLQLAIGRLWIILQGGVVEVDTPSGLASVRGSYLHVWVDPTIGETFVTCLEGVCTLGNEAGTIQLLAGQTATIKNAGQAPQAGKMTDEDVVNWLEMNPEATLVVVPLTATVAAGESQPTPEAKTNTPTPTLTLGPTPTASITPTPTNTLISVDCGPPLGWVLHTVKVGETLDSLAALYRVDEADIRKANCRGDMTFIVPGEKLYVPNVATSTPTNTPTPTPSQTPTPTGDWVQTQTVAAGGPTATPTNSPTTLSGAVGPDKAVIDSLDACFYSYRIKAVDADGIAEAKLIWTLDGSLPTRDAAISAGHYKLLSFLADDVYSVSNFLIDTTSKSPTVEVRFRFAVLDTLGNLTYEPADGSYGFKDNVNCGKTVGTVTSSPAGANITSPADCAQLYSVDVSDGNGISQVTVFYSLTDSTAPTPLTGSGSFTLPNTSGDTYEASVVIDTSTGGFAIPVTVAFEFKAKDTLGNQTLIGSGTYTDNALCAP